jgi:hypothetical protein
MRFWRPAAETQQRLPRLARQLPPCMAAFEVFTHKTAICASRHDYDEEDDPDDPMPVRRKQADLPTKARDLSQRTSPRAVGAAGRHL